MMLGENGQEFRSGAPSSGLEDLTGREAGPLTGPSRSLPRQLEAGTKTS